MKQPKKIDKDFIDKYWSTNNSQIPPKTHKNYFNALDVSHHIRFHFDGYFMKPVLNSGSNHSSDPTVVNPYFQKLIDSQRPSESSEIKLWRRNMYRPVTKVPCGKVVNSLKKIVKSADWKIDYSHAEPIKRIPDNEKIQEYCEKNFPNDDSIENWAYKTLVKWMLIDPNALCCVMPMDFNVDGNEFLRPYPYIITCKDVYDFKQGEYYVFLSPYTNEYKDADGKPVQGKILIFVTTTQYVLAKQNGYDTYVVEYFDHNIGYCPCFLLGGDNKTPDPLQPYYESFIQPMLPSLDMAAMDVSDLLAEKIQHVHSTFWSIQGQYCNACQGSGKVLAQGGQSIKQDCPDCGGRGALALSPFRNIEVNLNNSLSPDKNIPFPPAGYIEKDKEMVKLMRDEIETEVYDALSSINMEFLCEEPLNQSGKAKEVDRDELNNFVYGIAYHLVEEIIKPVYWFINELRYNKIVESLEEREKQLPEIPVPQNFDFLTERFAEDNLIKISAAPVSSGIKDAAEMDYIHKKFAEQPEVRNRLILVHDHDPLPGLEIAQINNLIMGGLAPKIDGVLSAYISSFATQILSENPEFMELEYDKQKEVLYQLAEAKLAEIESTMVEGIEVKDAMGNVVPNPTYSQKLAAKLTSQRQRTKDRDSLRNA